MQQNVQHRNAVTYWTKHSATYHCLAVTAVDLVPANDGKIDSKKILFSMTTTTLAMCITVLQDRVMAHSHQCR